MLKKLFQKLSPGRTPGAQIYKSSRHTIRNEQISHSALSVTKTLQNAGFSAYIVGGGVRDLLLELKPKDFDVATNATPEEILPLFRRSRPIGRRFKIVHVRFGKEIIEVTTFRAHHSQTNTPVDDAQQCDRGVLLRDNVYGDMESDAYRRDFTVNALYYDPSTAEIIDYTGGMADLSQRKLQIIGDPDARYKEDPVRMLRAIRFQTKLGFSMSEETERPIFQHADYLSHIPPARLFEEVLKLFMSGYATAILTSLKDYHLLNYLLPSTSNCLETGSEQDKKLLFLATSNTDRRIRTNQRVTPAFIYAAMMWPQLCSEMKKLKTEQNLSVHEALQRSAQGLVSQQLGYTAIPKRFLIPMREIWSLQFRLHKRQGNRAHQLLEHPRFRAAYDFLLLREDSGEHLEGLGAWWTKFQASNNDEKEKMIKALGAPKGRRRRPRRKASARE